MKGIEPLVGAALVIVISISAIVLALQLANPAIDRTRENLIYQEGLDNLNLIDGYVNQVAIEGNGSSRSAQFTVTDGEYFVFSDNESIQFVMDSKAQIVGVGVTKMVGKINITGFQNKVVMFIKYDTVDFQSSPNTLELGKGYHSLTLSYYGWDPSSQRQIIKITV